MAKGIVELELFLVRHGESMGNANLTDGLDDDNRSDPPLTEKGRKQASLLGEYFAEYPLDYLLSSGMRRALQTAEAVRMHQPANGAKQIEVHKVFTECNTGTDCVGKTIDELQKVFPFAVSALDTDKTERIIFHGADDTDEQLLTRGKEAIAYLRNRFHNGEKVMVAAHAAFNTFMLYAALGLSHVQVFDPSFFNTGITKIVFFKEGTGAFADVHLVYMNATPHLEKNFIYYGT